LELLFDVGDGGSVWEIILGILWNDFLNQALSNVFIISTVLVIHRRKVGTKLFREK
jgi:hypothetical protein